MKRVIGYMVLSALGMASEASDGDIESVAERLIIQTLEKQYLIDQENIKNRQVKVEKIEAFQGEHAADFTISLDIFYDNYNSVGYSATTRERRQYTVGLEQVEGVWQIIDYRYINPFVPQKTTGPNKTKTATELELKPLHLDESTDPQSYNDLLPKHLFKKQTWPSFQKMMFQPNSLIGKSTAVDYIVFLWRPDLAIRTAHLHHACK